MINAWTFLNYSEGARPRVAPPKSTPMSIRTLLRNTLSVNKTYELFIETRQLLIKYKNCGAWWLVGRFVAFLPNRRGFKSRSNRHAGTVCPSLAVACDASASNSDTVSLPLLCRGAAPVRLIMC